jgi:hypothetical protein
MKSTTAHYIILALSVVIVVLAAISLSQKKEKYTPLFYRSKMSPSSANAIYQGSNQCQQAVQNYCQLTNKTQRILGDVSYEGVAQGVYQSCGPQFPTEEICAAQNPMYRLTPGDMVVGGTHNNLL